MAVKVGRGPYGSQKKINKSKEIYNRHIDEEWIKMSRMRKPTMWFPNRSNTDRAVHAQKIAGGWKFWI